MALRYLEQMHDTRTLTAQHSTARARTHTQSGAQAHGVQLHTRMRKNALHIRTRASVSALGAWGQRAAALCVDCSMRMRARVFTLGNGAWARDADQLSQSG